MSDYGHDFHDTPIAMDRNTPVVLEAMEKLEDALKGRIEAAKRAPKGSTVVCPNCGKSFTKNHPAQYVCSNWRAVKKGKKNCKDVLRNRLEGLGWAIATNTGSDEYCDDYE